MKTVTLTDEAAGRLEAWKTTPDEPLSEVILRQVADPAPAPLPEPDLDSDAEVSPGQFLGCMSGTVIFHPGWDDPCRWRCGMPTAMTGKPPLAAAFQRHRR